MTVYSAGVSAPGARGRKPLGTMSRPELVAVLDQVRELEDGPLELALRRELVRLDREQWMFEEHTS
ncbi:hypothetical protein RIF23_20420 [Lipingzhangella sp. LS1_29]|uniref:Uncharacterized protein n=1 Tax=Lipingzhangella rawalii TaxID=2055835 RepID=A0ABU2HCU1_9ACTN|nr:hypothetical protein [Lipingzhangella rawalii]MDS1272655.1 hypothetical protein [Lipingzhangella rawalii]